MASAGVCRSDADLVGHLFYQLFDRTYATIYEAKRFGYCRAMMLVHSFAEYNRTARDASMLRGVQRLCPGGGDACCEARRGIAG